jgi:hypothetical protein
VRLYAITCEILARECCRAILNSPHSVFLHMQPFNLHVEPDNLRKTVQSAIDNVPSELYDYVVLGYGLCSRGTAGLMARDIPLVMPRAHDCITLLLGSKDKYMKEFTENPGTYYFSAGWVEHNEGEERQGVMEAVKDIQEQERYKEYLEKYGEDNAKYLIEQERLWLNNYNRAAFINWEIGNVDIYRDFTKRFAQSRSWKYDEIAGNTGLIDGLFDGEWNDDEYLIVQPGERVLDDINGKIVIAK